MTVADLDRLVSRTEVSPVTKIGLKAVRRAVLTGRCGDPEVSEATWSVSIDSEAGRQVRMSFSFKRK